MNQQSFAIVSACFFFLVIIYYCNYIWTKLRLELQYKKKEKSYYNHLYLKQKYNYSSCLLTIHSGPICILGRWGLYTFTQTCDLSKVRPRFDQKKKILCIHNEIYKILILRVSMCLQFFFKSFLSSKNKNNFFFSFKSWRFDLILTFRFLKKKKIKNPYIQKSFVKNDAGLLLLLLFFF